MKDKETLYTVTVDTKNGERVIAVPKKIMTKSKKVLTLNIIMGKLKYHK